MFLIISIFLLYACPSQSTDHDPIIAEEVSTNYSQETEVIEHEDEISDRDNQVSAIEKTDEVKLDEKSTATQSVPVEDELVVQEDIEQVIMTQAQSDTTEKVVNDTRDDNKPAVMEEGNYGEVLEQYGVKDKSSENGIHDGWDVLLRKYVSVNGKVNYKALQSNLSRFEAYLDKLKDTSPESLSGNKALAFWINAYNAFTVKLILDNYPVKSIMDLDNGKVWDRKWIKISGKTYSFNQIEHEIIRPQFNEPRIHFAVNCAARSCPPLMNKAWTAEDMEKDLEAQTRKFVNNTNYNLITKSKLSLSKIFEWYKGDFGNIQSFIDKYSDVDVSANASVTYYDYDWSLNE